MKIFSLGLCGLCIFAAASNVAAIKTDPQNQRKIDEIVAIGNRAATSGLFTKEWRTLVQETNEYAKKQKIGPQYATHIEIIYRMLENNQPELASGQAEKLQRMAAEEKDKIKKSRFTSKEKRWAAERYEAIFEALKKVADVLADKGTEYRPLPGRPAPRPEPYHPLPPKGPATPKSEYMTLPPKNPTQYQQPTQEELARIDLTQEMYN